MADLFPSACAALGINACRLGISMTQETHNMFRCRRQVAFARLFRAAVVLAALAAVSPLFAEGGFGETPKLGEKAPPFSLLDLDNRRVTLAGELSHGPVVLVLLRGW